MGPLLNERTRRLWAAAESIAIGFGGDAIVSSATGLARQTIRNGRHELAAGVTTTRIRQPGAGRPGIEDTQPGITEALDLLVEPLTRGDPMSPLRWTCKSAAKLAGALTAQGWPSVRRRAGSLWTDSAIVSTPCRRPAKARRTPIATPSSNTSTRPRRRSSDAGNP